MTVTEALDRLDTGFIMENGSDTKGPSDRGGGSGHRGGGSEDLRFLDLEIAEALHGEATKRAREAYVQALTERIKEKLVARLAEQIDALAELAADDLIADLEANLDIERRIKSRAVQREEHAARLKALFAIEEPPNED